MAAVIVTSISTAVAIGALGLGIASFAQVLGRLRRLRYRYARYRRSARDDSEALERTMALIRREDLTGCGRRLVCELGAMPPRRLDARQRDVLRLVGKTHPGSSLHDLRNAHKLSALQEYRLIRKLGEKGYDCRRAFPLCPYNGTELMNAITGYVS